MANINLGRVSPLAVGEYDSTITYDKLDIVNYQGSSYIAKKSVPVGTSTENNEYWQLLAEGAAPLSIGTVNTVSASTGASASITGSYNAPVLNLNIPRGVAGNESIDDTAGEGDMDYVWSANKSYKEITDLKNSTDSTAINTERLVDTMPNDFLQVDDLTDTVTYTNQNLTYDGDISYSNVRALSSFIPLGRGISVYNSNTSDTDGMRYWIRVFDMDKNLIGNAKFTATDRVTAGTGTGFGVTEIATVNLDNIIGALQGAAYVRLLVRYMETASKPISPSDVWLEYTGLRFIGGKLENVFLKQDTYNTLFDKSTNLYDGHELMVGRLTTTGTVDTTQTDYETTDYIDLGNNVGKYIMAENTNGAIGYYSIGFYTEELAFISGKNSVSVTAMQIPVGARYVRMTIKYGANFFQFIGINTSSSALPYEPYYKLIKPSNLPTSAQNWYKGKTISALGDSITANGNDLGLESTHSAWREFVYETLLLSQVVVNNGIGGTRVSGIGENAMWQDSRINAISTSSDVVLFNGGMNDWGGNAPMGTPDSVDTDTYMGALNVIAQKLLTRFPSKRIFWMTTTYGRNNNNATPDMNNIGLTTWDYAEAIRVIAKNYGIPVIDLAAECGWNKYNYTNYVNEEDGIYIHPNRNGGKRMAEVIIGRLLQFQPID